MAHKVPRLDEEMPESQKRKISKAMRGKRKSKANKLAISAALKAYWQRRRA